MTNGHLRVLMQLYQKSRPLAFPPRVLEPENAMNRKGTTFFFLCLVQLGGMELMPPTVELACSRYSLIFIEKHKSFIFDLCLMKVYDLNSIKCVSNRTWFLRTSSLMFIRNERVVSLKATWMCFYSATYDCLRIPGQKEVMIEYSRT